MTSRNVDLVRSIYAARERGDYSSAEWADPELELVFVDGPSPGRCRGVAAAAEGFSDFVSEWENYTVAVDEYRELDDERILVLNRRSGRGKTSGLEIGEVQPEGAAVFHVRDCRVTKLMLYWDRGRALADLGLEE